MKRKIIPQFELPFASDHFNLIVEQTTDGERVQREAREAERRRKLAEKQQTSLDLCLK